jgi:hypothetical protein
MSFSQFDAGAAVVALQLSQMLLRLIVKHGLLTRQQVEDELLRLVKKNRDGPSNAIVVSMLAQLASAYSAQRRRPQPRRNKNTAKPDRRGRLH